MRARAVVLALALVLAPLGAQGADLVVWWLKAYDAHEDEAVREIIAVFEQKTGKHLELELLPYDEMQAKVPAAIEAGHPPDFLFGTVYAFGQWAYEDRLIDLSDEILPFASLFDPNTLAFATLLDATHRPARIPPLPKAVVEAVVTRTLKAAAPDEATHWSAPAIALGQRAEQRICYRVCPSTA